MTTPPVGWPEPFTQKPNEVLDCPAVNLAAQEAGVTVTVVPDLTTEAADHDWEIVAVAGSWKLSRQLLTVDDVPLRTVVDRQ